MREVNALDKEKRLTDYGRQIAVTLGPECIEIYPSAVFRRIVEAIHKIPDRAKRVQVQRLFVGYAVESELDGQGRILVPTMLRDLKALETDVVLAGQTDHLELWPSALWFSSTAEGQTGYADAFAAIPL